MALGVEMLLQSMGFDPKEVGSQFAQAKEMLAKTLAHFDARLNKLEAQQDEILRKLEAQKHGENVPR